jgi:uncharacterized repeat protein (TIGR01451 family)/LPXTG-motif cell wall-anchored protein
VVTATVTTAADGTYLVPNLPYGPYRVAVDPASLPGGMVPTFDLDAIATANVAGLTLDGVLPNRSDADFSYTGTGSLGDLVWHDRNADGAVAVGEEPLPGVTVTVTWLGPDRAAGGGDDVTFVRTTGPDGAYAVGNLPAGAYTVVIDPATLPTGFDPVFDLDGGRDRRAVVALTAGQHRTDVDFGEREEADLAITKTHANALVQSGDRLSYTLSVRNLGPGVARTVAVSDPLPAGLTFVGASGTGWTCSTAGQVVSCTLVTDLAAGIAAADISVVVDVGNAAAPQVVNTATVASATPDPVLGDNSASDPTVVNGVELSLSKALLDRLVPNKLANYRLTVTNHGPSIALANRVTVTDTLPTGLTGVSASSPGFSCTVSDTVVTCVSTTDMTVDETRTLDVTVRVAAKATGVLQNTAQVEGLSIDPVAGNNAAAAAGTVTASALPRTGADVIRLLLAAAAAVLLGSVLVLTGRRRKAMPTATG